TVEMAAHQVQPLFEPRVGPGLACSCPPVELAEEERIGQRSAADRDRRAACLLEHRGRVGNGPYVAVGHDWNSFHGLDHGTYAMPVHGTREPLCAGSAVHGHRGRARPLKLACQDRRRQRFVVPAQPHLHSDRIEMARTTAPTSSTARSIWQSNAEPPPLRTTFLTGQPMLMSTTVAPCASTHRAASSISGMTCPSR